MSQYNPYDSPPPPGGPPQMPPDPYGYQPYDNPNPYGSAPTLINVAAILNLVMAGIDILWSGFWIFVAIFVAVGGIPPDVPLGPERPAPGPDAVSPTAIMAVITVIGLIALTAGIVKLIAGIKLLRKRRGAWGFGLAAGILGCTQLWCWYLCVLPMAIGIFTIVVMALQTTRNYLRDSAAAAAAPPDQPQF